MAFCVFKAINLAIYEQRRFLFPFLLPCVRAKHSTNVVRIKGRNHKPVDRYLFKVVLHELAPQIKHVGAIIYCSSTRKK